MDEGAGPAENGRKLIAPTDKILLDVSTLTLILTKACHANGGEAVKPFDIAVILGSSMRREPAAHIASSIQKFSPHFEAVGRGAKIPV